MKNELVVSNQLDKRFVASLFDKYAVAKNSIEKFAEFAKDNSEITNYFLQGSSTSQYLLRDIFELDPAIKALDSEYWSAAINQTNVLSCMTADKRNEWNEMIREFKTPEFEIDSVINTIQNLLLNRSTYMAEKVDGLFRNLSGTHVTNSPSAFKKRMIMNYIGTPCRWSDTPSVNYERCEFIDDLRSVVDMILKRDSDKFRNSYRDVSRLYTNGEIGKWQEFDGGAFKMKVYKKGTAHLEVHPTIASKLNQMLAELYPSAIPPVHREVKTASKAHDLKYDFLSRSVVRGLDSVLGRLKQAGSKWSISSYWVDGEQVKEVGEILELIGALKTKSEYIFSFNPNIVLSKIIRTGVLPEKKSHQYYPTPKSVVKLVQKIANVSNTDLILEPSAGQGSLIEGLNPENIDCIEIDQINCEILKSKGYNSNCKDFMKQKIFKYYDIILMNPPFNNGRAKAHVDHALKFLAKGGRLITVVPSNFDTSDLTDRLIGVYEVPNNAFKESGTNVSTIILELEQ